MGKDNTDDTNEKDDATGAGKKGKAASKLKKKSLTGEDEVSTSDSSSELEAVQTKKGEPDDNLRRRAEWFQKRTGSS
jgi:hypothetical protein